MKATERAELGLRTQSVFTIILTPTRFRRRGEETESPSERTNERTNERTEWPLLDLLRRIEVTPKNIHYIVPTHSDSNNSGHADMVGVKVYLCPQPFQWTLDKHSEDKDKSLRSAFALDLIFLDTHECLGGQARRRDVRACMRSDTAFRPLFLSLTLAWHSRLRCSLTCAGQRKCG